MKAVCVYCGSAMGRSPIYSSAAEAAGREIARRGLRLIYGGASVGLMGKVADAALAAGGEVVGVMPKSLIEREIEHRGLTELHEVTSMHDRKARMMELSDAILTLPGGFGTFDEVMEAITWAQLGHHRKPIGFLNVGGFYDRLFQFLDFVSAEGFIRPAHRSMILIEHEIGPLLDRLSQVGLRS